MRTSFLSKPQPTVTAIQSALRTVIVTFLVIFICPTGYGKEGFSTSASQMPNDSKLAWDSTFLIAGPLAGGVGVGSSFLVAMAVERNNVRVFLLTNKHVIENLCPSIGPCDGVYLTHGAQLLPRSVELIPNGSQSFRVRSLTVEKMSNNPDLALLSGTVDPEVFAGLRPLRIATSCQPTEINSVVNIGFPETALRKSLALDPLDTPIQEFWSEGIVTSFVSRAGRDGKDANWLETTADALAGNSGGPAIASGMVVGVVTKTYSVPENNFEYTGNEIRKVSQTALVPCREITNFLADTKAFIASISGHP